jgi:predicted permease
MNLSLSMELRRAFRRLLRAPGFSVSAVVLIALSVGGMAAVITAGWSLYLKPLPFAEPDRLVTISAYSSRFGMDMGFSAALAEELNQIDEPGRIGLAEPPFEQRLASGESLRAVRIDHRLLEVLGVPVLTGRMFARDDTRPGAEAVALIGARYWREHYASDPAVIGRSLALAGGSLRIVGVLPELLAIPESGIQLWMPMTLGPEQTGPDAVANMGSLLWVARPPVGESIDVYRQRLQTRIDGDSRLAALTGMLETTFRLRPLRALWAEGREQALIILAVATGVVLLASWLNLAGLWLARWTGRDHELALQHSIGAGRRILLVGVLLEYLVLLVPGALAASVVAAGGIELLYRLEVLGESGPLRAAVAWPTLASVAVFAVLGAAPITALLAIRIRRLANAAVGHLGGKGLGARNQGMRLQRGLMVGQIGIAFSLLLVLALLFSSWRNLLNEDLGFDVKRLIAANIVAADGAIFSTGPDSAAAGAVERLRALPGVESVSWSNLVPFGRMEMLSTISLPDRPDEPLSARPRSAGPGFFQTAGIDLVAGRDFGPEDVGDEVLNVIVDQAFADLYLGGDALGRTIGLANGPDSSRNDRVVGVVDSVRHMSPDEATRHPTFYTHAQQPGAQLQLLIRTSMSPELLARDVGRLLEGELGQQRVDFVASLESLVRQTIDDREPQLMLIAVFAGLALLLVFYGLYAMTSYQVRTRTAELGLRKALGANHARMIADELARVARLLPGGLALGMTGGFLGLRLVKSRLYQASPDQPGLWLLAAGAIALTIMLAALVPALRGSRVTPMEALRHE